MENSKYTEISTLACSLEKYNVVLKPEVGKTLNLDHVAQAFLLSSSCY